MSEVFKETQLSSSAIFKSPLRIWTIAAGTFTQLVRMKTFWFLLVFAVLIVVVGNLNIKSEVATAHLTTIKRIAFGAMDTFAWLYAIAATALLIPRDIEDRTLYTILTKPVQRIEYLAGKLIGVVLVVGASLAAMVVICMVMLWFKQATAIATEVSLMEADPRYTIDDINEQIALINQQGVRASLFVAALASLLKASVVAALAIMISTFASSSLFTIISSIFIFLIGHAHGMVIETWREWTNNSFITEILFKVFKLLIPDFQLFSFSDGIVLGANVVPSLVWGMILLTCGYLVIYLLISLIIFLHKEF